MTTHPTCVPHYHGTLEELADEIGNLRYDALIVFVNALRSNLHQQSLADFERGRTQLSMTLEDAACDLQSAAVSLQKAWRISEPHM